MKLSICFLFGFFLITFTNLMYSQTAEAPAVGDGSASNPYQIASAENLYWISQNSGQWNKHYVQTADIDISIVANWSPIGNNSTYFTGSYDGQNFKIENLQIDRGSTDYIGLFGYIKGTTSDYVEIKNLALENVDIQGHDKVGAISGLAQNILLQNVSVTGNVSGNDIVGGIIGRFYGEGSHNYVKIENSWTNCNVSGHSWVGGFTGSASGGGYGHMEIYKVYTLGTVRGYRYTGGLVGIATVYQNQGYGQISNSYSRASVTRTYGQYGSFGGLIGRASNLKVKYCYSTGAIDCGTTDRGFIGDEYDANTYTANFFDSETSTQSSSIGATAKTTAEMTTKSTFTDNGWDFFDEYPNGTDEIWDINDTINDGYPFFNTRVHGEIPGNALNFDGTNDYVEIADNDALDLTTNYTIEIWVKFNSFSWLGGLVSKYNSPSSRGYMLRLTGVAPYSGLTFDEMSTDTGILELNTWYHIAAVNDNGTRHLYLNGVEQQLTGAGTVVQANTDPLTIGVDYLQSGRYIDADIDEVRIWNDVRTECEIQGYKNTELNGDEPNLVAYYNFNQGDAGGDNASETSLTNKVGADLNGTLNNFSLNGSSSNWIFSYADLEGTGNFVDNSSPEITSTHNNQEIGDGTNCSAALPDYTNDVVAHDACDDNLTITQSPAAGTIISNPTTVTLRATDDAGNYAEVSFDVSVLDNENPVISSSQNDIDINAESNCQVTLGDYTSTIVATDNCDDNLEYSQTPPSGTLLSGSANLVTLIATDYSGNADSATFYVNVVDTMPPVISSRNDTTIIADDCQIIVPDFTSDMSFTDNCDNNIDVIQNPASGTTLNVGTYQVTITATDDENNSGETNFYLNVKDTVVPILSKVNNKIVFLDSPGATYTETTDTLNPATYSDNCGVASITNNYNDSTTLNGAEFYVGTNLVKWKITDNSGNSDSTHFNVVVYYYENYAPPVEICKLIADDHQDYDFFGTSVDISDNYAIVSADEDDDNGTNAGSVYIYQKNNEGNWEQLTKLLASDGGSNDFFGNSVSISGDYAVVGAKLYDGTQTNSGAVYVFHNNSGTWEEMQILQPSDQNEDEQFGVSVDIDGNYIIVGAYEDDESSSQAGAAYIFYNNNGVWEQQDKIFGNDIATTDRFGEAVAISGDYAVVGCPHHDNNGYFSGAAYVFYNNNGTWGQQAKLLPSDAASDYYFGCSVDIYGDNIIIGSQNNNTAGHYAGAAYIFEKNGENWADTTETAILMPQDLAAEDQFGHTVAIYADRAVVGAYFDDDNGQSSGSAYIFDKPLTGWADMSETDKIISSDGNTGNYFGKAVNIYGENIICGAPGDNDNGNSSGSAYIFGIPLPVLLAQPENQTNICPPAEVVLSVSGNNIDFYQWQQSADNGENFADISDDEIYSGSQTANLTVTTDATINHFQYRCIVSNLYHSSVSDTVVISLENENPVIYCVDNQEVAADNTHQYTVQGTEFDLISAEDNCNIASIENDYNNLNTLADAQLPEGLTTITWTVVDSAGNSTDCSFDVLVNQYVNIDDIDNEISIFPNPTTGIVKIESSIKNLTVNVEDVTGNIIMQTTDNQIDLTNYAAGVYFVKIYAEKEIFIFKIIKK